MAETTEFKQVKAQRLLEFEQRMVRCLKQEDYEGALRAAEDAASLDPASKRIQEFLPLLREKVRLDQPTDSEDEGEDDSGDEQEDPAGQEDEAEATSSSDQGSDSSEDEDEEDEQEGSISDAGSEESVSGAVGTIATGVQQIALSTSNMKISHSQRSQFRAALARSIKDLKHKQLAQELVASDPLLGA